MKFPIEKRQNNTFILNLFLRSYILLPTVKQKMKTEGKSGWLLLVMSLLVMGLSATMSSASFGDQYHRGRRKTMLPDEATSSLGLNRAASSIVLPVHGNVYPIG